MASVKRDGGTDGRTRDGFNRVVVDTTGYTRPGTPAFGDFRLLLM